MLLNVHIFFMATNIMMWIFYVLTLRTQPGYIRADRSGYDETIKMVMPIPQGYLILRV